MQKKNESFISFFHFTLLVFSYSIILVCVFSLFRTYYLFRFGEIQKLWQHGYELISAYALGSRFDIKVIAFIIVAPTLLLQLFGLIFQKRVAIFFLTINRYWLIFASFLLLSVYYIDIYYYSYFQTHIDVRIYGFFEDDTVATLASMWEEYPIIWGFFFFSISFLLLFWIIDSIYNIAKSIAPPQFTLFKKIIFIATCITLTVMGARGFSFHVFPLQKDNISISPLQFINFLSYNAPLSLRDAYKDHKRFRYSLDMDSVLSRYKVNSLEQAMKDFYNRKEIPKQKDELFFQQIRGKNTNPNKKFHVVIIFMESWSSYYFKFHNAKVNLLASLEKEMENLIHFRHITSLQNGTMTNLEAVLISHSEGALSQTKYGSHEFSLAITRPFLAKSYNTHFITSGRLSWRNIDSFLPKQGFQQLSGENILAKKYKSEKNSWGVFDEHMFDYIYESLVSAKKPQFIFGLTTTHHPPYKIPKNYKKYPIEITNDIQKRSKVDTSFLKRAFLSFQYMNDSLGRFLKKIRTSRLSENTIIAITGDHNTWACFDFEYDELIWKYTVPLFFYIPKELKKNLKIDPTRFGSHADIMNTILPLVTTSSSKNTFFTNFGSDLFGRNTDNAYMMNDSGWLINKIGAVNMGNTSFYYEWVDPKNYTLLKPTKSPSKKNALDKLRQKGRIRNVIMGYAVRSDVQKKISEAK